MRYFFDMFLDGLRIRDPRGSELASPEDVQPEALATADELAREFPDKVGRGFVLEVIDDRGNPVFATPVKRR